MLYHKSWHHILKDFDIINTRTGENIMARNQRTYDNEYKAQQLSLLRK